MTGAPWQTKALFQYTDEELLEEAKRVAQPGTIVLSVTREERMRQIQSEAAFRLEHPEAAQERHYVRPELAEEVVA